VRGDGASGTDGAEQRSRCERCWSGPYTWAKMRPIRTYFDGKWLYNVAALTPASAATSASRVASHPRSVNSRSPASSNATALRYRFVTAARFRGPALNADGPRGRVDVHPAHRG